MPRQPRNNASNNATVEVEVEETVDDMGAEDAVQMASEPSDGTNFLDRVLPDELLSRFRGVFPFAPDEVILHAAIESAMVHITTFRKIGNAAALAWEQDNPDALQDAIDKAHAQARAAGQQ